METRVDVGVVVVQGLSTDGYGQSGRYLYIKRDGR